MFSIFMRLYLEDIPLSLIKIPHKNPCLYAEDANPKISSKTLDKIHLAYAYSLLKRMRE